MRRAFLLLAALVFALAPPARAQGDSIVIRSYDVDAVVHREGHVDVTETIRFAFFGPWNGILRDLSLQHTNGDGRPEKLRVRLADQVVDESGSAYRWEEEDAEGAMRRLRIYVPGAHDAERTVVVRYRVENAIRFFYAGSEPGPLDELYWNATGNAWTMPIERARVRVRLPEGVVPTQTAAYTGYEGATERGADVAAEGSVVVFTSTRRLEAGEGMTVAAGWAPGAIASRPSEDAHATRETVRLWPLGLPFLAFFLAFRSWRRRGRDPRAEAIVVGYEPPEGMSPAELGTLIDHQAEMRDITATLVDLAVRGYVGVEERTEKKLLGLISSTDYAFHLRRPREAWSELAEHERRFLDALFRQAAHADVTWDAVKAAFADARRAHEAGEEIDREAVSRRLMEAGTVQAEVVTLSELQNRFYKSLPGIREAIYERLMERGHYVHRPDKVKGNWIGLAVVMVMAGIFGAVILMEAGPGWISAGALAAGGVVSGIIVFAFGLAMPARTPKGARAREAALGFREFLDRVESDRYRRMVTSPETFERYLPHAMAFGVEARWAKAFDDLYREPPEWYSGGSYDGFRASTFAARMNSMTTTAGSTMSSSPSSSGSGGGGSSGGGSGGGGGSGF